MLANIAVSLRPVTKPSNGLLANATVTIPGLCTIGDIKVVQTTRGIWAFGPSRKNTNPNDEAPYYTIVQLAEPLRTHILEVYKLQFPGAESAPEQPSA